jgi:hypothetical protein
MTARPTLRWFFWLSCVLAAFFCARTAEANAPMCDARGMSIEAPPPFTPIRDARIEAGSGPLCRDPAPLLEIGHRVQRGPDVVDGGSIESWVNVTSAPFAKPDSMRAMHVSAAGLAKAPGYDIGVFRPPRAA